MANRPHRRPRSQLAPSLIAIAAALLVIFLAAAIMYVLMPLITVSDGGTASNAISAPRTSGSSLTFHALPTETPSDLELIESTSTSTATTTPSPIEPPTETSTAEMMAAAALATVQPLAPNYGASRWAAPPTPTEQRVAGGPAAQPTPDVAQPPAIAPDSTTIAPSPTATATPTPPATATSEPSPTVAVTPEPTGSMTVELATHTPAPTESTIDAEATGRRPHAKLTGSPIAN